MGLVNNGNILANQSTPLLIDVNTQGFTNNGTLNVSASDTLQITGAANSFLNFNSGTGTLTGGNYVVAGTLQFDNANITTNAANITLTGVAAKIVNQVGTNALLGFNTNAASGSFTLAGGQALVTTVELPARFVHQGPENQVRTRLAAGGNRIRTIGPAAAKGSAGRCQSGRRHDQWNT